MNSLPPRVCRKSILKTLWRCAGASTRIAACLLAAARAEAIETTSPPSSAISDNAFWEQFQHQTEVDKFAPQTAKEEGPPVRLKDGYLFRYRAPETVRKVYLAGDFNGWAHNNQGKVSNSRFAMSKSPAGIWFKWVVLPKSKCQYQFVVESQDESQSWVPDPMVKARDDAGHSLLENIPGSEASEDTTSPERSPSRKLKPVALDPKSNVPRLLDLQPEKVWVRPDQTNSLRVIPPAPLAAEAETRLKLTIQTPLGKVVNTSVQPFEPRENRLPVPALGQAGGYLARVELVKGNQILSESHVVLTVADNIADDLRYGFYASFSQQGGDYDAKADMLANLHVNAVEFYDFFPGHGNYAPSRKDYRFEPFGIAIHADDVAKKIEADRKRNIQAIAYVSAYAASESVIKEHPFPMTDEKGTAKIFNGEIMTETEADTRSKPKWFWLTNIADDSSWFAYIMAEFGRVLTGKPGILPAFDGFEIDTYGDASDTKFYAHGSRRNGDPLAEVLHDFVGATRNLAKGTAPSAMVAFNNINEFTGDRMHDVSDFLFLELWRFYTDHLDDIVDICFHQRSDCHQRVILKLYPADMLAKQTAWPPASLARILGAALTGGGSLMVAGEPDEQNRVLHGLNSLFYPDHRPVRSGCEELLRDYNNHDALLFGYTHGPEVINTTLPVFVPGCIVRTYAAPHNRALVIQMLHAGTDRAWSADLVEPKAKENFEVAFELPGNLVPKSVFYSSPDSPALQFPVPVDFEGSAGTIRILIPQLKVHGTLILQY